MPTYIPVSRDCQPGYSPTRLSAPLAACLPAHTSTPFLASCQLGYPLPEPFLPLLIPTHASVSLPSRSSPFGTSTLASYSLPSRSSQTSRSPARLAYAGALPLSLTYFSRPTPYFPVLPARIPYAGGLLTSLPQLLQFHQSPIVAIKLILKTLTNFFYATPIPIPNTIINLSSYLLVFATSLMLLSKLCFV